MGMGTDHVLVGQAKTAGFVPEVWSDEIIAAYKKKLKIGKIKMGRSWVSQYTLEPHMIEAQKAANDEPYDKLNPFDIRNAKGIFSKAEISAYWLDKYGVSADVA